MDYPTPYQKKTLWAALTGLAMLSIGAMVVLGIWVTGRTLSFLQPLLFPVAAAGVMAYLLDPVVVWMVRHRIPRFRAVIMVFALVTLASVAMLLWLVPTIYSQTIRLGSAVPVYAAKARVMLDYEIKRYGNKLPNFGPFKRATPEPTQSTPTSIPLTPLAPLVPLNVVTTPPAPDELEIEAAKDPYKVLFGPNAQAWIQQQVPEISAKAWSIVRGSIGGFVGIFGFTVGLFIIPVYLFFFLAETDNIAKNWTGFLPLRDSKFKDEVVIVIGQINDYIIAFFRGQLLVSIIDGLLVGTALLLMGLPFALLIGLMVCFLCIIPYLGVVICWIPAVIIAAVEFKDWQHPLAVTAIFIAVQQIEGFFVAPKIIGNSVGLHPMTIIISVFAWSLLLGGLLGALLAIPLTATLKVLLSRYVWQRQSAEAILLFTE
ncbi:MAG: AI-2E family transporter [Chthoniobacterales bacterium]